MSSTDVSQQTSSIVPPQPQVVPATSHMMEYKLRTDRVVRFRVKPKVSSKSTHPIANARLLAAEKARNGSSRNAAQSLGPSTRKVYKFDRDTGESSWVTEVVRTPSSKVRSVDAKRRAAERARVEAVASRLPRLAEVYPGMEVKGVVTSVSNFGAFVNVGWKKDALVHKREATLAGDCDPHEVFEVGQQISAWVIDVDEGDAQRRAKLALSLVSAYGKASLRDLVVGDIYTGEVTRVERYGLFVAFGATIDGLLHESQLYGETSTFAVGDAIDVEITRVESEMGRVSLRHVVQDAGVDSSFSSNTTTAANSVASSSLVVPPPAAATSTSSARRRRYSSASSSYSLGDAVISTAGSATSGDADATSKKESKSARRRRRRRAAKEQRQQQL